MKHFVIGTAGHVDHGKTELVKALTGKETDRLKEEKERGISIELGFAPFMLPGGMLAGLVDVPGHERFIKNMLAGVGGIDLVLLVVAADEGVMPQTREHLEIIDLLQVQEGIIVITKADLVDEDWLEMVTEETRELVRGTVLESSPVVVVSAVTGQGIPELVALIDEVAGRLKERPATGHARIPVDRVFSITGFGTVATGTMVEGQLHTGDTVEILPEGKEARIRGLQVHGQKVEVAEAGQRVAVNLAGLEFDEILRGSVLASPNTLRPSHRLDIRIRLLGSAAKPLSNRARVRVHIGTSEILARVILLEKEELQPGDSGFAQLECEQPLVAAKGDRLVIRSYSPMRTIAGGTVIDPLPPKRRRLDSSVIEAMRTKELGTPEELLEQFMSASAQIVYSGDELARGLGQGDDTARETVNDLVSQGRVRRFSVDGRIYYILGSTYDAKLADLADALDKYHNSFPLRPGLPKEEVRSRNFAGLNIKMFNSMLDLFQADGIIKTVGENVARRVFEPGPPQAQRQLFQNVEDKYLSGGYQTPGWDEVTAEFRLKQAEAEEMLSYFVNSRILVKLDDGVLVHRANLEKARDKVVGFLREHKEISLGEARDLLQTSRKFALPIMAYLDREKVTRRVEDKRVLY